MNNISLIRNFHKTHEFFLKRINLLKPYFEINKESIDLYLSSQLSDLEKDVKAVEEELKEKSKELDPEIVKAAAYLKISDELDYKIRFLPQFLFQSSVALLYAQLEIYLEKVALLIERESGKIRPEWNKKIPKFHFLLGTIRDYGLNINIPLFLEHKINNLNHIRNELVHSINGDPLRGREDRLCEDIQSLIEEQDTNYQFLLMSVEDATSLINKVKEAFEGCYKE